MLAGVDIGRKHDLTVIWINEYSGERHLCRRLICLAGMKFSAQESHPHPQDYMRDWQTADNFFEKNSKSQCGAIRRV